MKFLRPFLWIFSTLFSFNMSLQGEKKACICEPNSFSNFFFKFHEFKRNMQLLSNVANYTGNTGLKAEKVGEQRLHQQKYINLEKEKQTNKHLNSPVLMYSILLVSYCCHNKLSQRLKIQKSFVLLSWRSEIQSGSPWDDIENTRLQPLWTLQEDSFPCLFYFLEAAHSCSCM